jgi:inorganic triphosphatase YgiF
VSREVERKYAVDDEFAVPDLSGCGPVASVGEAQGVELVATYYDTPDLRLAREGVTLRRRTGGHDAGWTLKLPAVGDPEGRDELAAPLGLSRTPPPDLLDLVTAWVRGAELAPVGELTTARTARLLRDADGRALAELVDDRVTVTGHSESAQGVTVFREVEVELCEGVDRSLLDVVGEALVAAGALSDGEPQPKLVRALGPAALAEPSPPSPAGKVRRRAPAGDLVTAYLRGQVRALLQQDARVRQDAEDAVHKARVATRRLRSALRTFAPLLDAEAVAGLGEELRWLARELGTARDAEVLLVRLRALVRSQPEEMVLGPVAARIDERLLSDLLLARESGLAAMREPRYVALLDRLVALATDPPLTSKAERPVSDVVPGRVLRAWRRLERRLAPPPATAPLSPRSMTSSSTKPVRQPSGRATPPRPRPSPTARTRSPTRRSSRTSRRSSASTRTRWSPGGCCATSEWRRTARVRTPSPTAGWPRANRRRPRPPAPPCPRSGTRPPAPGTGAGSRTDPRRTHSTTEQRENNRWSARRSPRA